MDAGWVSPPTTLPSAEKESIAINKDGSFTKPGENARGFSREMNRR